MAIDDNTLYGLTGAQIKELPGKITGGVDSRVKTNAGAPTTTTAGTVGQLLEDTTNGKLYICTDATNPYVWTEVGITYGDFTGAGSSTAGSHGLVPAPAAGDNTKYLSGDGTWKTVSQYALPIATANDLGGIKVGNRLTIDASTGVLSADSQTDNNFTNTLKTKLDGIASGAEVNVQADWNEASSSSDAYIKNKPTIPAAQVNSDWNASSGVAEILNKPSLATVATTGAYSDLTGTPTIPAAQIQSDWTQSDNTKLDFIKNKPTIPTVNNATLTITQNGTSAGTFTANASSNATIALTDTTYSAFTGATSSVAGSAGLVPAPTTSDPDKYLKGDGTWGSISIPTVNNATLTIQKNGTTVQTFTANASSDTTANIEVPVITMTTTDPGEGAALAANHFIGVYE